MKYFKKVLPLLVVAVVAALVYSFFHIDGTEIRNIKRLPDNCSVEVTVRNNKNDDVIEYNLTYTQKEAIKKLLTDNSYTRRMSKTIIGMLPDNRYTIFVNWADSFTKPVHITVLGNEYISVMGQFGSNYHKINNDNFEKQLLDILNN